MGKLTFLFFCILVLSAHCAIGQDLILKKLDYNNKYYLRWAPVNKEIFQKIITSEISIEFANVNDDFKETDFDLQKIEEIKFKPLSEKLNANKNLNSPNQIKSSILNVFLKSNADKKSLEQNFAFALLTASVDSSFAQYIQLGYSSVFKNKKAFRIKVTNGNIKSNVVIVDGNKEDYPNPHDLIASQQSSKVLLQWPAINDVKYFSAYNVIRSENNTEFKIVNKVPLFFFKSQYEKDKTAMAFIDTSVVAGKTYYYKIIGINHFGFASDSSETIKITLKHSFKPDIYFDTIIAVGNKLKIKAAIKVNSILEQSLFQKISLQYCLKDGGKFNEVDQINTIAITAINFLTSFNKRGYYRISVISSQGDTISSYSRYWFCYDSIAPVVPIGISGIISKDGLVHLQWKKNTDFDLKGYLIYRANSLNDEFVEVSKGLVSKEFFYDTLDLNNLDSLIYYRVQAVDSNLNHSKLSAILRIVKPDKIAPVKIVLRDMRVKPNCIILTWYNSSSSDVKQTEVNCFENGKPIRNWKLLMGDTSQTLIDTQVIAGNYYQYKFTVIDKANNKAEVISPNKLYEPGYRIALKGVKAIANRDKKQIVLTWEIPKEKVYTYHVYRLKNDGQLQLHKTIDGTATQFTDNELNINNTYGYSIKAVFTNGIGTKLTKVVMVKY